jgi:shikimate kinase
VNNIFLIGPMGVGKTTIGRQLAKIFEMNFKDSDKEIEQITGASIPLIFELEGESGFRRRECEVINELTQEKNIVLATGGGAILNPCNRIFLKERGKVIYLHASIEQLLKRTRRTKNRPLLQTKNPRKCLQKILIERTPIYKELADLTIETSYPIKQVVKNIIIQLHKKT